MNWRIVQPWCWAKLWYFTQPSDFPSRLVSATFSGSPNRGFRTFHSQWSQQFPPDFEASECFFVDKTLYGVPLKKPLQRLDILHWASSWIAIVPSWQFFHFCSVKITSKTQKSSLHENIKVDFHLDGYLKKTSVKDWHLSGFFLGSQTQNIRWCLSGHLVGYLHILPSPDRPPDVGDFQGFIGFHVWYINYLHFVDLCGKSRSILYDIHGS